MCRKIPVQQGIKMNIYVNTGLAGDVTVIKEGSIEGVPFEVAEVVSSETRRILAVPNGTRLMVEEFKKKSEAGSCLRAYMVAMVTALAVAHTEALYAEGLVAKVELEDRNLVEELRRIESDLRLTIKLLAPDLRITGHFGIAKLTWTLESGVQSALTGGALPIVKGKPRVFHIPGSGSLH